MQNQDQISILREFHKYVYPLLDLQELYKLTTFLLCKEINKEIMVHRNSKEPSESSKNDKNNEENTVCANLHEPSACSENEFNFNLKNYNLLIK